MFCFLKKSSSHLAIFKSNFECVSVFQLHVCTRPYSANSVCALIFPITSHHAPVKIKSHKLGLTAMATFNYSFCLFGVHELSLQVTVISTCSDMTMCSELSEVNAGAIWLLENILLLLCVFFFVVSPPLPGCVIVGFPRVDIWLRLACLSREAQIGRGEGEVTGP